MKKKNITTYILTASLAIGLASCEQALDLQPVSEGTTNNSYITANDAEAALVGAYDSYHIEYYYWENVVFNDVVSDNYYAGGDQAEIFPFDDLTVTPINGRLLKNWTQLYRGIARANMVLAKVPAIADERLDAIVDPVSKASRRDQILGEAAFIRAYQYYQLAKTWGGVPLELVPVTSTAPAVVHKERATQEAVYEQIIEDLLFALDDRLPDTYGDDPNVNKARATRGAANALLAKVYAQKPVPDYAKVLAHCDIVINSPAGYKLLDNFDHLFDGHHYNNEESIMEIQFQAPSEQLNWGAQQTLPPGREGVIPYRKFIVPSIDLVAAFDSEGDKVRKESSIVWSTPELWTDEFWGEEIPFAFKWRNAAGWFSTSRMYLIRLGDIVLLKAEALNELGRPGEAADVVDIIRARVKLGNVPVEKRGSQADMRLVIEKERRLELCQEGQRWDDLRRYGRAVEVMNQLNEINLRTNAKKEYVMTKEKELLPIPQQERDRNPKLGQNDGY